MTTALAFRDLTLGYDRHPAVHHLDAEIVSGSLTAVIGPNGAGKSTLLKAITGALKPFEGVLDRAGRAHGEIAYLPQAAEIDRAFPIAVRDLVAMGLWRETGPFRAIGRRQALRIDAAIAAVGLSGFETRQIGALSGGQMQRTLFARLLLQDAEMVLLDEPFAAIDAKTAADLIGVVRRWHGEGRTIVAVLHDLETVKAHFPRTLMLARELVAHGPTASVVTPENLLRARRMCEAFDAASPVCDRSAA